MTRTGTRLMALSILLALAGAACTDNPPESSSGTDIESGRLSVQSTSTECNLSATTAPSGNLVFSVANEGNQATEFHLLAEDGVGVVGEVENIGPGLTRELVVRVEPGSYVTSCKPGMTGDGIRSELTVTDSSSGS